MGNLTLEIPDPIFRLAVDTDCSGETNWSEHYTVTVFVGDFVLFSRRFDEDEDYGSPRYVTTQEAAIEKVTEEFGERLRHALGF